MLEHMRLICWVLPQGKALNIDVLSNVKIIYLPPNGGMVTSLCMHLEQIGFVLKRIVLQGEQGVFSNNYSFDVINKFEVGVTCFT